MSSKMNSTIQVCVQQILPSRTHYMDLTGKDIIDKNKYQLYYH